MNKKQLPEQIRKALKELGYKDGDRVRVESAGINRHEVYVSGKSIGIWDSIKETFVE